MTETANLIAPGPERRSRYRGQRSDVIVASIVGTSIPAILYTNYLVLDHPVVTSGPNLWGYLVLGAAGLLLGALIGIGNYKSWAPTVYIVNVALATAVVAILATANTSVDDYGPVTIPLIMVGIVVQASIFLYSISIARRDRSAWTAPASVAISLMGVASIYLGNYFIVLQSEAVKSGEEILFYSTDECANKSDKSEACTASLRDVGLLPIWTIIDAFPYGEPAETLSWEQPTYYESAKIGWILLFEKISLAITLVQLAKDGAEFLWKRGKASPS